MHIKNSHNTQTSFDFRDDVYATIGNMMNIIKMLCFLRDKKMLSRKRALASFSKHELYTKIDANKAFLVLGMSGTDTGVFTEIPAASLVISYADHADVEVYVNTSSNDSLTPPIALLSGASIYEYPPCSFFSTLFYALNPSVEKKVLKIAKKLGIDVSHVREEFVRTTGMVPQMSSKIIDKLTDWEELSRKSISINLYIDFSSHRRVRRIRRLGIEYSADIGIGSPNLSIKLMYNNYSLDYIIVGENIPLSTYLLLSSLVSPEEIHEVKNITSKIAQVMYKSFIYYKIKEKIEKEV